MGFLINTDSWAKSTLLPPYDKENLVSVYTIRKKCKERIWLHDVLDGNDIPYALEIVGYRKGAKRIYYEKQVIFVEKKNKKKALSLIKEFQDVKNIVIEDINEENMIDNLENGLPQVKCPACGKEVDFDYGRCPFCKADL